VGRTWYACTPQPFFREALGVGDDTAAGWFDRLAGEYDQVVPYFAGFGEQLIGWLDPPSGARLLDLGAGGGAPWRRRPTGAAAWSWRSMPRRGWSGAWPPSTSGWVPR
jgi:hypothetical protein